MPLFTDSPEDEELPEKNVAQELEYKDVSITLDDAPVDTLLMHLDGSKWVVDYYRQLVTSDMDIGSHNVNDTALTQPYERINDMELRVTTPLDETFNEENEAQLTGGAYTFVGFKPNKGDMFVAQIGPRKVQFTISAVERKSLMNSTTYEVSYRSVADHSGATGRALDEKVVKEVNFILDRIKYGKSPIVTESAYGKMQHLRKWLDRLLEHYFTQFYNGEYATLLIPEQASTIYDGALVEFVHKVVDKTQYPMYSNINELNCDNSMRLNGTSVLDAILDRDEFGLYNAAKQFARSSGRNYKQVGVYGSVYLSGIDEIYHYKPIVEKVGRIIDQPLSPSPDAPTVFPYGGVNIEEDSVVAIKPVTEDDYYIFSAPFYSQDTGTSMLESLVIEYLKGKPISADQVLPLAQDTVSWGKLEQYYYIPVMWVMIQAALRESE